MKQLMTKLLIAVAAMATMVPAFAQEKATKEEAVALVKKAVAYYKANGKEKLFAAINEQNPEFKYKDLYLFGSATKEGSPLGAHGANPKMVGKDMSALKDAEGKPFAKEITDLGRSPEGKGWVDYKWPNPISKAIEQKTTYVERVDDIYLACGVYK